MSASGGPAIALATRLAAVVRGLAPRRRSEPRPALWYRATGALNALVWHAPVPRRVSARLSLWVYRSPPMAAAYVLTILAALEAAGVSALVSGGWGIDALLGEQTRIHRDLDLMLDFADERRAVDVLVGLGFREHYRVDSDVPTFTRRVLRDTRARVVDLHPVELATMPESFAEGRIGSRVVPCLSTAFQLSAHEGYRQRRHDRADVAALRRLH